MDQRNDLFHPLLFHRITPQTTSYMFTVFIGNKEIRIPSEQLFILSPSAYQKCLEEDQIFVIPFNTSLKFSAKKLCEAFEYLLSLFSCETSIVIQPKAAPQFLHIARKLTNSELNQCALDAKKGNSSNFSLKLPQAPIPLDLQNFTLIINNQQVSVNRAFLSMISNKVYQEILDECDRFLLRITVSLKVSLDAFINALESILDFSQPLKVTDFQSFSEIKQVLDSPIDFIGTLIIDKYDFSNIHNCIEFLSQPEATLSSDTMQIAADVLARNFELIPQYFLSECSFEVFEMILRSNELHGSSEVVFFHSLKKRLLHDRSFFPLLKYLFIPALSIQDLKDFFEMIRFDEISIEVLELIKSALFGPYVSPKPNRWDSDQNCVQFGDIQQIIEKINSFSKEQCSLFDKLNIFFGEVACLHAELDEWETKNSILKNQLDEKKEKEKILRDEIEQLRSQIKQTTQRETRLRMENNSLQKIQLISPVNSSRNPGRFSQVMNKISQKDYSFVFTLNDKSDKEALWRYGVCLAKGLGVNRNIQAAIELFRQSSDISDSLFWLGKYTQNPKASIEYLSKAAQNNHPAALWFLGYHYFYGQGVSKDEKRAKDLMEQSADLGDKYWTLRISLCFRQSLYKFEKNETKALKYERIANSESVSDCSLFDPAPVDAFFTK